MPKAAVARIEEQVRHARLVQIGPFEDQHLGVEFHRLFVALADDGRLVDHARFDWHFCLQPSQRLR